MEQTDDGEQLVLDLFTPRSLYALCAERGITNLSVVTSRRLSKSWYVKIHRMSGERELYIPELFDNASEQIKEALITWATLPAGIRKHHDVVLKEKKRNLERLLREFISAYSPVHRKNNIVTNQKWPTVGNVYDLKEIFDKVNNDYYSAKLSAFLRWGSFASKTSYQVTRKDSSGNDWHYITIAGIYNHAKVPRFAIESVMYHEMLHIHIQPRNSNGRRVIHGSDFRKMEQSFPWYQQWKAWERKALPGIIRSLRRKKH